MLNCNEENKILVDFSNTCNQNNELGKQVSLLLECCANHSKEIKYNGETSTIYNIFLGGAKKYMELKKVDSIDVITFTIVFLEVEKQIRNEIEEMKGVKKYQCSKDVMNAINSLKSQK